MQPPIRGRRLGLAIVLAATVAACGGARSTGQPAVSFPVATAGPATVAPTPLSGAQLSPAPSSVPLASPGSTAGTAFSVTTRESSELVDQLDLLLRQLDGELAANDDAAVNQGE